MYNITILFSFHIELGKCNSAELYSIIEKIQPDIIFEELPFYDFCNIYAEGYSPESLEAIAIKNYIKKYPIKHFPVDTFEINDSDIFTGYEMIVNKSMEYTKLFEQQLSMISLAGYSFINSNKFVELLDKMQIIEKNVLLEINDPYLLSQYKSFGELNDKRDIAMLQNIYNYSKQHQYSKAMFICGAEHRKSIIKKILEYDRNEKLKLNWTFYNSNE